MSTADSRTFDQTYRDASEALPPSIVKDCIDDILRTAKSFLSSPSSSLTVLDVGAGRGEYAFELESRVKKVVAVEPELKAFEQAQILKKKYQSSVTLIPGFIEDIPFNEKFDLAISLTTVEHMPQARESMKHILSSLKPGGIIYLTAPNRLWPIECHYGLPFLSWLPLPLANFYLRIMGRGTSYEDCSYMRTYWGMKNLFRGLDCDVHFVLPDPNNSYIGVGDTRFWTRLMRVTGIALIRRFPFMWIFSKAFLMVIQKRG